MSQKMHLSEEHAWILMAHDFKKGIVGILDEKYDAETVARLLECLPSVAQLNKRTFEFLWGILIAYEKEKVVIESAMFTLHYFLTQTLGITAETLEREMNVTMLCQTIRKLWSLYPDIEECEKLLRKFDPVYRTFE